MKPQSILTGLFFLSFITACTTAPVETEISRMPEIKWEESIIDGSVLEPAPLGENQQLIESAGYPWENIIVINDKIGRINAMPLKKTCGSYQLEWRLGQVFEIVTLRLIPKGKDLVLSGSFKEVLDASFSIDCEKIFVIAKKENEVVELFSYQLRSEEWSQVTDGLSPPFETIETAKPLVEFVYPIDDRYLLVSAMRPATGLDALTVFSVQAVYDLQNKSLTWIPERDLLPPVLYNFKDQKLFHFQSSSLADEGWLNRIEISLPNLSENSENLVYGDFDKRIQYLYPSTPIFMCIRPNFESPEEYASCMNDFWKLAFSKKN